ncbi:MAG: hypothetical protein AAF620_20230 [Bacteroidota bacterium]
MIEKESRINGEVFRRRFDDKDKKTREVYYLLELVFLDSEIEIVMTTTTIKNGVCGGRNAHKKQLMLLT